MKRRISALFLTLVVISVLTCAPAFADPPYTAIDTSAEDMPFPKVCPDVDFSYHLEGVTEGTRHDNGDGTYRWAVKVSGTGYFYTLSTPPKTVPFLTRSNFQLQTSTADFPPAVAYANIISVQRTGDLRVDLPGGARIYSEAGLWAFGPDSFKNVGHFPGLGEAPELCAALH